MITCAGSDISHLSNLLVIGRIDLLAKLFEKVYIPLAVWEKLSILKNFNRDSAPIKDTEWFSIQKPQIRDLSKKLRKELYPGNSESIALVLELEI